VSSTAIKLVEDATLTPILPFRAVQFLKIANCGKEGRHNTPTTEEQLALSPHHPHSTRTTWVNDQHLSGAKQPGVAVQQGLLLPAQASTLWSALVMRSTQG
jgi:hypothetical protein